MRVLVGCEVSGRVRDAFIAAGHDAVSCDLLPSDRPGPHIEGDVRDVLEDGWDAGLFFPPCTYLCSSGLHWNTRRPERAVLTHEAMMFVFALLDAPILRIALENPIGCISTNYRQPDQIVQPWMFGEDASKATCLWLKGLPKLVPTKIIKPRYVCRNCGVETRNGKGPDVLTFQCPNCCGTRFRRLWGNQTPSGQNKLGPSPTRAKERGLTYQGLADAMAAQWGKL